MYSNDFYSKFMSLQFNSFKSFGILCFNIWIVYLILVCLFASFIYVFAFLTIEAKVCKKYDFCNSNLCDKANLHIYKLKF